MCIYCNTCDYIYVCVLAISLFIPFVNGQRRDADLKKRNLLLVVYYSKNIRLEEKESNERDNTNILNMQHNSTITLQRFMTGHQTDNQEQTDNGRIAIML